MDEWVKITPPYPTPKVFFYLPPHLFGTFYLPGEVTLKWGEVSFIGGEVLRGAVTFVGGR